MKEKVILIGTGGHALIMIDIINAMNKYKIIGVTTKNPDQTSFFEGIPVIGDDDVLKSYKQKGINSVAIGIGGFINNSARKAIYNRIKGLGFNVIRAIHPQSVISPTALLGEGVTIFAGVIINPYVKVGDNVIIATGATIDHETEIENHILVSAGVTIGGYTLIKEGALIALGAKIISGIKVGKNAFVAAGAVVVKNVPDEASVYGIPAKQQIAI